MNLKYVPISKILFLYGGLGTIFTAMFSLITTFISCSKRNDDIYDMYDYLCLVLDNNGDRYIENFKVYFTNHILKDLLLDLFYINERGELVLVDYKTDYVEEGEEQALIEKYRKQLELYKLALEKSLNMKVSKIIIYSVYLGKELQINWHKTKNVVK